MNVDAKRAHLKLLETLAPERIRTHRQVFREGNQILPGAGHRAHRKGVNSGVPVALRDHRRKVVTELVGQINPTTGKQWTYDEIAFWLGISKGAVARYARVTGVAPSLKR
jgi:hypothetical protein